jgi:hypothetical protein
VAQNYFGGLFCPYPVQGHRKRVQSEVPLYLQTISILDRLDLKSMTVPCFIPEDVIYFLQNKFFDFVLL